ncbi:MAG: acyl-CoA thioesterase [Acidobacteria bacterium]|nr:acyl-CoA thioesterase [Acidobacteriota bacterium]
MTADFDTDANTTPRDARPMSGSQASMTEIVMPNDANPHGSVSGGRVLHLIDICAAVAALRHARRPVVTASFDDVAFLAPVPIGHVLLLDGQVTGVGRTSIEVRVAVRGENPVTGDLRHTTTAYVTFVALDDAGRPATVPGLVASTPDEEATLERARQRRSARLDRIHRD